MQLSDPPRAGTPEGAALGIELRFPELSDVDGLYAAVQESFPELHPWMGWCHQGYSRQETLEFIIAQAQARTDGSGFEFLIVGEEGQILGVCGVNGIDAEAGTANLGYWIRTSATGRGLATEAVQRLVRWTFEHTPVERIEIRAAKDNVGSRRVAAKAGAHQRKVLEGGLEVGDRTYDAVVFTLERPGS
ncbi:MAG: GNAT family N-acetyltransferase [Acidobacteriota bacterium]|nr:GNAT family N-acetyltransferase [Acidobacteriota bacterium]